MRRIIFFILVVSLTRNSISQQNIAINATGALPHSSAQLDVSSISKGILIPRMTGAQRAVIVSPATGLLVYDTDTNSFWVYNGTIWTNLSPAANSWSMNGNVGTNPAIHYIGTGDNTDLRFKINSGNAGLLGINGNIFWGLRSGNSNTTGRYNIAIGIDALKLNTTPSNLVAIGDSALMNNTTGSLNTAVGSKALYLNTTGSNNSAGGFRALYTNTTGSNNTALGILALTLNTTGSENTATGFGALNSNTTGIGNIATGGQALNSNTSGSYNIATGYQALFSNATGSNNIGIGERALFANTTGIENIASGTEALRYNTTGNNNTANGTLALYGNTTGYSNVAVGTSALLNNTTRSNLVAIGDSSLFNNSDGFTNTAIGSKTLFANTTGYSNTATGSLALYSNSAGTNNTANGAAAMYNNNGNNNTALGGNSMNANTSGNDNTAVGAGSLFQNTSGAFNTAVGVTSLSTNATGNYNTALGTQSMHFNISGDNNTALGYNSLSGNTTGHHNVAFGNSALSGYNGSFNTAIGYGADVSSSLINATAIGAEARVDCNSCIVLGAVNPVLSGGYLTNVGIGVSSPSARLSLSANGDQLAGTAASDVFRSNAGYLSSTTYSMMNLANIGFYASNTNNVSLGIKAFRSSFGLDWTTSSILLGLDVDNTKMAGGATAYFAISANGNFGFGTSLPGYLLEVNGTAGKPGGGSWTASSDARLKQSVQPYTEGLTTLLQINPVKYHYNELSGYDTKPEYVGVLAQDLKQVASYMVNTFQKNGESYYSVDNSSMIYILINAVKEQQVQIEDLKKENAEIKLLLNIK